MTDDLPPGYIARVLDSLDAGGCACHLHPPCDLCTTMTEEHAGIYRDHGGPTLRSHLEAIDDGADPPALPDLPAPPPRSPPTSYTPPPPPRERTPEEQAIDAIVGRFQLNPKEYMTTNVDTHGEWSRKPIAYSCRSATDSVTGTTIYSSWWCAQIDDGDSELELIGRIRKWAARQIAKGATP